jgi:hypothetical protein
MRKQIDENISNILNNAENKNFSSLYNHPKLINEIFLRQRGKSQNRFAYFNNDQRGVGAKREITTKLLSNYVNI